MKWEPGPLKPLSEDAPAADIEPGGFGDLARAEMTQGADWENYLDNVAGALNLFAAERPGDRLKDFIDPALAYANEVAGQDPTAEFDQLNADTLDTEGSIVASYGNVPAE